MHRGAHAASVAAYVPVIMRMVRVNCDGVSYFDAVWAFLNKRAWVSLTLRLICGYLLRSLQPFLTCIYETLLDI